MTGSLTAILEREFDACSELEIPGFGQRPMLTPSSEEELCEVLRFANRESKTVLPIGLASKLSWLPALGRVDFALSTQKLSGVVAYEPGDGTLTALAGTRMSELETEVARGRHLVTPQVAGAETATLGGTLASGQSGLDRAAFGPPRHHVLGMRVALADGRVVTSGGRLVKNVTGFDMHRLYSGSFGSLCVIVEASLRLFPEHETRAVLQRECADLAEAVSLTALITKSKLTPQFLSLSAVPGAPVMLTAVIVGRPDTTRWLLKQFGQLLPAARTLESAEGDAEIARIRNLDLRDGSWSDLRVTCLPSKLGAVLELARKQLPNAELHARPGVAELLLRVPATTETSELREFQARCFSLEARVHWRRSPGQDSLQKRETVASRLSLKLRRELDPGSLFAGEVPTLVVQTDSEASQ